jgi:hypothetical protein
MPGKGADRPPEDPVPPEFREGVYGNATFTGAGPGGGGSGRTRTP